MDMEDQQSDGQGVQGGQSLRGLLSNQPRTLLQALLGTGGGKPMIKLVEQDGEQFFQITPNEENKAEASEGEGPLSSEPQIEEIVEDPHVTAPETKSPRLQTVAAEVLGSSSGESNDTPATPAEMSLRQTAEAHQTSSSSDEDEDGDDAEKDGIINDELDDEDRAQLPSGGPDSCGAAVVVTALVGGEKPFLITANAGDSRCVLCRNGKAVAMSEDHKPQLESENNRIIKAGGKVSSLAPEDTHHSLKSSVYTYTRIRWSSVCRCFGVELGLISILRSLEVVLTGTLISQEHSEIYFINAIKG